MGRPVRRVHAASSRPPDIRVLGGCGGACAAPLAAGREEPSDLGVSVPACCGGREAPPGRGLGGKAGPRP